MEEQKKKTGWFSRLKQGLKKTQVNLVGIFTGGVVDEDFLSELEFSLISSDIGVGPTELILEKLRESIKLKGLKTQDEVKTELRDIIAQILEPAQAELDLNSHKPLIIMMTGVNGAGKTTSIGKLARLFAEKDKTVLLAAADTFRAAAKEQLAVWGERNGIEVISQQNGDPASVAYDAISSGKSRGVDIVMVDTAGRLPTQTNLMNELSKIKRVQGKALEGAPHEVILVVDGTNGQNALAQVKAFNEAAQLTGLIVTKLDGTAKGGVLVALAAQSKKTIPIYYIGVGEKMEDLQPFNAREFASALVGLDQ